MAKNTERNKYTTQAVLNLVFDPDEATLALSIDSNATDGSAMPANPVIVPVGGEYRATATTYADGAATVDQADINGNKKVTQATLLAGEDLTNDVIKTEHRYSYFGPVVSDTAIKSGAGFVHTITISQADAAPTAGTIQVRDSTSAGAGTVMFEWNLTTAVFVPFTITLDCSFGVGLYIDFTTTGDVNVQGSYR